MNSSYADTTSNAKKFCYPAVPNLSLRYQRLILKFWLICTDVLALALAFKIALWIRFDLKIAFSPEFIPNSEFYFSLAAIVISLWILLFLISNLYSLQIKLGGITEYSRVFNACTIGAMLLVFISFLAHQFVFSRGWLVFFWMLSFILVAASRFTNRRLVYALRKSGYLLTPAIIVGTSREAAALASDLYEWRASGLRILGFVSSSRAEPEIGGGNFPILGSVREIREIIAKHGIEDIVVAITAVHHDEILKLGEELNVIPNVNLRFSSGLYELFTTGVTVKTFGTVPLISVNKVRLEPEEALVKCMMDYALTLVFLLFTWPIYLLIALLVKLDSPGPVFHRRKVLGVYGQPFIAFKFRTMFSNGDDFLKDKPELMQKLQTDYKLKDDPRITRTGRWLRKLSLDELPQLFNVILGQMSLVGPRFITTEEAENKYGLHRLNLLTVKPGMTGLWQVSGRSDISYEDRIRLDMFYIRNYSIWLDLQILFVQTIPAVLKSRGAY
jgi:exopolysaccharide biosynthesis polyprenyl glycosylphosphotransferase